MIKSLRINYWLKPRLAINRLIVLPVPVSEVTKVENLVHSLKFIYYADDFYFYMLNFKSSKIFLINVY